MKQSRRDTAYGFIDSIKSVVSPSISDKKKIVAKRNSPSAGLLSLIAKDKASKDRKERQAKIGASKGKFKIKYGHHSGRWEKE